MAAHAHDAPRERALSSAACRVAIAALWLTLALAPPRANAADDIELALGADGDAVTVSLRARDAHVADVLAELARAAGFRLHLPADLAQARGTWDFSELPLEEALRRVAGSRSLLLSHEPGGAAPRLAGVQVLALSAPPSPAPPPAEPEPAQPDAETLRWAKVLQSGGDALSRRMAVAELERLGSEPAVRALEAALSDRDVELRREVVEALGRLSTDAALMGVGRAALGDPAPEVRLSAVEALAANPGQRSRQFLREAARDRDESVRAAAARALGPDRP